MHPPYSYLDLLNICDNARISRPSYVPSSFDDEPLVAWNLSPDINSPKIGLLRPAVVQQLIQDNIKRRESHREPLWDINMTDTKPRISFTSSIDTAAKRTVVMQELTTQWRDDGHFDDVCGTKKWRSEMVSSRIGGRPTVPH
jgi:hypothetical protein